MSTGAGIDRDLLLITHICQSAARDRCCRSKLFSDVPQPDPAGVSKRRKGPKLPDEMFTVDVSLLSPNFVAGFTVKLIF